MYIVLGMTSTSCTISMEL